MESLPYAGDESSFFEGLKYFHEKYSLPATQIVYNLKREKMQDQIAVIHAEKFLESLEL